MSEPNEPIELELIRSIACVEVSITRSEAKPTSAPDWYMEIDGRLGSEEDDDVEFSGMGFIFVISLLSFNDARPRGISELDFKAADEWTVADALRHFRFEHGELHLSTDYVRGRCMKTDVTVRSNGTFTVTTTNRGKAAERWVARLQGKKHLSAVSLQEALTDNPGLLPPSPRAEDP